MESRQCTSEEMNAVVMDALTCYGSLCEKLSLLCRCEFDEIGKHEGVRTR